MNDTNILVHGTGSASDPKTFEFHITAQSHDLTWLFDAVVILAALAAVAGFLLLSYFGKRRK